MTIEPAAIERILQRLCIARSGTATATTTGHWALEIEDDSDPPETLTFVQGVSASGLELTCDAPLDRYSVDQARSVAELQTELATALTLEKIRFTTFAEVAAFIDGRYEAEIHADDGYLVLGPGEEVPISITNPHVSREPWIEVSAAFEHEANAAWLLEKNGEMTSVRFEAANDSVGLVAALPISIVTAQRLLEMIDDVAVMRAVLLDEYEGSDASDDEDGPEQWEGSAIVGPWQDKTVCLRALDDSLLRSGFLKLATREADCEVAHVHRIGDTMWVTVDPPILGDLAKHLAEPRLFAVDLEIADDELHATRAHLIELALDEDGEVMLHETLGSEPEVRDIDAAVRAWELRLAARAVEVAETAAVTSRAVYYRAL